MADVFVEAVFDRRLTKVAEAVLADAERSAAEHETARQVLSTCDRIATRLRTEAGQLRDVLESAGVPIESIEPIERRQNHTITFLVADAGIAARAIAAIEPLGFDPWERWEHGALESFHRSAEEMTAGRTNGETLVVRFRWASRRQRRLVERVVRPTSGDWHMIGLPRWAWRAYPLVRIVRLVAERVGLRTRHQDSLGPFLATPDDLVAPLLRHAAVGPSDLLVDLGCGDGRVVVAAAELMGCRARGVELEAGLVTRARRRAANAGVDDRVRIVRGDARSADVSEATTVFVFLPVDVFADLLPTLLAQMSSGAQLIAHEQTRLPVRLRPQPTDSAIVLGDGAVTVAHRWVV